MLVPEEHSFHPFRTGDRPETLYRYHGFFYAKLPGVALGCAQRMIDDFRTLAANKIMMPLGTPMKGEQRIQMALAEVTALVASARAYQDKALTDMTLALEAGDEPSHEQRAAIGLMCVHAVQTAVRVSELIAEHAGTAVLFATSPLERRRRDILTMAGHVVAQKRTLQMLGQMLFGAQAPSYF